MYQFGSSVLATVALHIDPQSEYRPPAVWVNDEPIDDLMFNFEEPSAATGYVRAVQHIDGFKLKPDAQWLFKIDAEWRMPVWPQWVLGAQLADNRLVTKIQTQRNFMTEATITWGSWLYGQMPKDVDFRSFSAPTPNSGGEDA
ncbi:hypothetical protein [Arthrobacter sp. UYCu723]